MTMKRRDALKSLGGLAAMAPFAKFLSGCSSDDGPVGITNYVYLMMENRSYDHLFGARSMEEGLPGNGLTAGLTNPDSNDAPIAIYPNPIDLGMPTAMQCDIDPPHGWDAAHLSFNNGMNNGFVKAHQMDHMDMTSTEVMKYMRRGNVPVSWALADAYTSCDRWFCSVMGPTLPNRAYWHTGTSFGVKDNAGILEKFSSVPVPTIYNRLQEKGVDWAYYFGNVAVVSLLGSPGPYQLDLGANDGTGNIRRFGDSMMGSGQFFQDCKNGKLPTVSYIDPSFGSNDDHPPAHPILGQQLLAAVYMALAKSPQWKNTLLVVTYDENGGYHDHVPPPTNAADETMAKFGIEGFNQMGFRVPAMVIGPYVKQGFVSSVTRDHCSALKHLQTTFELDPINARIDAAEDLTDCIDMERLEKGDWAKPIELPDVDVEAWPYLDAACSAGAGFRPVSDPITEFAAQNPGKFAKEYDLRSDADRDVYLASIVRNLRALRRS